MSRKILVTGGAGFIGSNFIHYWVDRYPEDTIINLDKLTYAGNLDNLKALEGNPRYYFVKGDISDSEVVGGLFQKGLNVVVNFAAETHVDRSIGDPDDFIRTDVYGTYVLLEAARHNEVECFIQISTDEVYGSVEDGFSRETDPLMPRNPYAASKAGADRLAYSYFATYDLPVIITGRVIHTGQHPGCIVGVNKRCHVGAVVGAQHDVAQSVVIVGVFVEGTRADPRLIEQ